MIVKFLSSTFEPAEGVNFDYQKHPMPKVLLNGQNLTSTTGGQSIELNDSMFTISNEVQLTEIPMARRFNSILSMIA